VAGSQVHGNTGGQIVAARAILKQILSKMGCDQNYKRASLKTSDQFMHFIHSQALIVQDGPLASLFGVSRSHTYRHMVGLLCTSDQPVAEASTYTGWHNRQTSMPSAGFEPATPLTKRPQTYPLHRAATGIGMKAYTHCNIYLWPTGRCQYRQYSQNIGWFRDPVRTSKKTKNISITKIILIMLFKWQWESCKTQ
jgi:hypothetical protein